VINQNVHRLYLEDQFEKNVRSFFQTDKYVEGDLEFWFVKPCIKDREPETEWEDIVAVVRLKDIVCGCSFSCPKETNSDYSNDVSAFCFLSYVVECCATRVYEELIFEYNMRYAKTKKHRKWGRDMSIDMIDFSWNCTEETIKEKKSKTKQT
jgi:hypothetical protein